MENKPIPINKNAQRDVFFDICFHLFASCSQHAFDKDLKSKIFNKTKFKLQIKNIIRI